MARMNRCRLRKSESELYFDINFLPHHEQITKDSAWFPKHRCLVIFEKSQDAPASLHLFRRAWFSYISCVLSPTRCVCLEQPRKPEMSFNIYAQQTDPSLQNLHSLGQHLQSCLLLEPLVLNHNFCFTRWRWISYGTPDAVLVS